MLMRMIMLMVMMIMMVLPRAVVDTLVAVVVVTALQ